MKYEDIQVDYEALRHIQLSFRDAAENTKQIDHLLLEHLDLLRQTWHSEAALDFFTDFESDLQPGVYDLSQALLEAERVIGETILIFQQAEEEAAAYFRANGGGGAPIGRIGTGMNVSANNPLRRKVTQVANLSDGDWLGDHPDISNVFVIGGIQMSPEQSALLTLKIKQLLGGDINVTGIYNETGTYPGYDAEDLVNVIKDLGGKLSEQDWQGSLLGIARIGGMFASQHNPLFSDLMQSWDDIDEAAGMPRIGAPNAAVESTLQAILPKLERGEPISLVGYSQGGAIVNAVVTRIASTHPEYLGQIKVTTFGGAGSTFPTGLADEQHLGYAHEQGYLFDPVPRIADMLTPGHEDSRTMYITREREVDYNKESMSLITDVIGHDDDDYIHHLDPNKVKP